MNVGSRVGPETVVCLIEVMKTFSRVLYGGDTAYFDGFRDVGKVDLAIFGIGAYNPYVAAHATPEQAWEMMGHMRADFLEQAAQGCELVWQLPVGERGSLVGAGGGERQQGKQDEDALHGTSSIGEAGAPIRFLVTHVDHKADPAHRALQVAKLRELFPVGGADAQHGLAQSSAVQSRVSRMSLMRARKAEA